MTSSAAFGLAARPDTIRARSTTVPNFESIAAAIAFRFGAREHDRKGVQDRHRLDSGQATKRSHLGGGRNEAERQFHVSRPAPRLEPVKRIVASSRAPPPSPAPPLRPRRRAPSARRSHANAAGAHTPPTSPPRPPQPPSRPRRPARQSRQTPNDSAGTHQFLAHSTPNRVTRKWTGPTTSEGASTRTDDTMPRRRPSCRVEAGRSTAARTRTPNYVLNDPTRHPATNAIEPKTYPATRRRVPPESPRVDHTLSAVLCG